ncbi:MAG TPA: polyhydroxyalkanoate synthesis repressor PhaR [Micropepsaceae bacterium]|nr:polyhydroxyalkanoate synthesis repressor PhaR [Micropepsaceae bacterium]
MSDRKNGKADPIIIKKYANRRLYNTGTSSYITLEQLCDMVKEGVEFEVRDARTGEDITRQVLAQIIFEEENKGQHLLPIQFLRQLIRFYGDSLQAFVPSYLELSMDSFAKNQDELRQKFADALGGKLGYRDFEQLTRQNLQMFDRAMRMFSPFGGMGGFGAEGQAASNARTTDKPEPQSPPAPRKDEIDELKDQVEAMRRQLAELAQRK